MHCAYLEPQLIVVLAVVSATEDLAEVLCLHPLQSLPQLVQRDALRAGILLEELPRAGECELVVVKFLRDAVGHPVRPSGELLQNGDVVRCETEKALPQLEIGVADAVLVNQAHGHLRSCEDVIRQTCNPRAREVREAHR
jgi:hypothetical protein